MSYELVVSNGTLVTPEQGQFRADLATENGLIAHIAQPGSLQGDREIDASGQYVLPGAIDPHTHHGIYRSLAEDAASESRSNLVGGATTIGNFFRRGHPYMEIMDDYFQQAEDNYFHDYFFSLGLLYPKHLEEMPQIIEELGITTFKWYMNYKFAAREKFDVDCDLMEDFGDEIVQTLAAQDAPTRLGFHSENVEITGTRNEEARAAGQTGYEAMVRGFPGYAEAQSMVSGAALAHQHDYGGFYAVHISSGRTADQLALLQNAGYRVMGETCPHYLTLTTSECDDRMKVNPPVRSRKDQKTLWRRLADGTIDCVGTDHCANLSENKIGETIWESQFGFPGTPVMLPLILSEGVHQGRLSLQRAVEVTSTNAARAWGIYPKKGTIRVGSDADLAVVDLQKTETVTPEFLQGAPDYSPWEGWEVTGWPTHTIVKGRLAYQEGEILGERGRGTHINRPL